MFTFAHFSDLHLSPVPRPRPLQLVNKRLQSYLSWLTKRQYRHKEEVLNCALAALRQYAPDHLCVTGDLVNLALPAEIEQATAWLRALGPELTCSVVPGNHDALVASALPQVHAAWAPWMGDSATAVRFPYVVRRGPVAFIGLSSAVATLPCLSSGRLDAKQLADLEDVLSSTGTEGCFRVVLIHHPPRLKSDSARRRLSNASELFGVLGTHGAELVLHGHLQKPVLGEIPGPGGSIPVFGAGSASLDDKGDGDCGHFHGFRLQGEPGAWKLCADHFRYRARTGAFTIESTQLLEYPVLPS